jgi:4-hydroxy-3-methylbut-2-enyl diphosphate reductase
LVVADHAEAEVLGSFISGEREWNRFDDYFANRYSAGFVPDRDLQRIGVVNQTTMLASDTQGIADYLRSVMVTRYGVASIADHFADTRDTLCYATNDNQQATMALFDQPADLAVVVGGYNSSNTSHLVELCELHMPTVFIQSEDDLLNAQTVRSFNLHKGVVEELVDILPQKNKPRIVVTSGASCPDSIVDRVIHKLVGYYKSEVSAEAVLQGLNG